ncbi:hypothetical protein MTR67_023057 [Solanum verrucosum]|uniref:Uncharacterized protein n=1 Tax=Solanum verrucosum TaxID=315347 RepID=A0AAF0QW19_SOLVR|nr:hypothetical protein MTR67_023057 [Solanum verrucosum]
MVRTGTFAVSFYGSAVRSVDQSTDRQWPPWFNTWSDYPYFPSMLCLLIYGHHLRSVYLNCLIMYFFQLSVYIRA